MGCCRRAFYRRLPQSELEKAGLLEFKKKSVAETQYHLTQRGRTAFNLIVEAVSRQASVRRR